MNSGSEAADQMVREGIQITSEAVKLSALGAKNLAAIALALARDNPKVRGRTRLNRLLRDGKELKAFPIKASDRTQFKQLAKHYGVLFAGIKDKTSEGELIDVLARAEDVSKLNRIFERMGYAVPAKGGPERKKGEARRPSENGLPMRERSVTQGGQTISTERPSVRDALARLKRETADMAERTGRKRVLQLPKRTPGSDER